MRELSSSARSDKRAKRVFVALLALVSLVVQANAALADVSADDKAKARAAYERATAANDRGDYATAARELALADELAPNSVTLQAALEAALDADAPTIGMELEARARLRPESGPITQLATKARERFSGRVGRVKLVCPGTSLCQAKLDDEEIRPSAERFVLAGKHVVYVTWGNRSETRSIEVSAGGLSVVDGLGEAGSSGPSSGLSPAWFVVGLTATMMGTVATSLAGSETKSLHDEFVGLRCDQPGAEPRCVRLAEDGRAAQLRTNVIVGATAAVGLTTVVLGVVTFGKKNPTPGSASGVTIEPRPGGAFARLVLVLP